jgi:hypothetical protein
VALKAERTPLFIQCKNSKTGVKAMSQPELIKLKEHSEQYGAVGIYVYTDGKKKYLYNTSTKDKIHLIPIPGKIMKQWVSDQKKLKKQNNILSCNCFIDCGVKHIYL